MTAERKARIEDMENRKSFRVLEVRTMPILFLLVLLTAGQSGCCRKSFSYPVMANVVRIEVVTKEKVTVKEIEDATTIDSIVRFIDERRSRWCSPDSSIPAVSGTLTLFKSQGGPGEIGLGKGFFVAKLADGKYLLKISPKEQQAFFKLLDIEEDRFF